MKKEPLALETPEAEAAEPALPKVPAKAGRPSKQVAGIKGKAKSLADLNKIYNEKFGGQAARNSAWAKSRIPLK
jgi:hypothetical protein